MYLTQATRLLTPRNAEEVNPVITTTFRFLWIMQGITNPLADVYYTFKHCLPSRTLPFRHLQSRRFPGGSRIGKRQQRMVQRHGSGVGALPELCQVPSPLRRYLGTTDYVNMQTEGSLEADSLRYFSSSGMLSIPVWQMVGRTRF
jgi:hypothetical protein